jgi:hypothetical protein
MISVLSKRRLESEVGENIVTPLTVAVPSTRTRASAALVTARQRIRLLSYNKLSVLMYQEL